MTIKRALISVSDKNGLAGFAAGLHELGVELISTSGTQTFLTDAGLPVTSVEQLTGSAEMLGGRVKTLHPHIHAAILARRNHEEDMASLEREGIVPIDLVVCNLYPFRHVAARRESSESDVVEFAPPVPMPAVLPETSCWICAIRAWTAATPSRVMTSPSAGARRSFVPRAQTPKRPPGTGRQPPRGAIHV